MLHLQSTFQLVQNNCPPSVNYYCSFWTQRDLEVLVLGIGMGSLQCSQRAQPTIVPKPCSIYIDTIAIIIMYTNKPFMCIHTGREKLGKRGGVDIRASPPMFSMWPCTGNLCMRFISQIQWIHWKNSWEGAWKYAQVSKLGALEQSKWTQCDLVFIHWSLLFLCSLLFLIG
jgi:hypothetical protein